MIRTLTLLCTCLCTAAPARADIAAALDNVLLPRFAAFAQSTAQLGEMAAQDCRADHIKPAYQTAFDAWAPISDLRLGPSEHATQTIAFWPDDRGFIPRALRVLIAAQNASALTDVALREASVATKGLFALDYLLYDLAFSYDSGSYTCALVQAIAADLQRNSAALSQAWANDFAPVLRSAGAAGNAQFMDANEGLRALFTQIDSGLEFSAASRIARPLGTFDKPRPKLAEAWRAGRPLANITLSVRGHVDLARALAGQDLPQTMAALARFDANVAKITDPSLQDLTDPAARLRAEAVQQSVNDIRSAIAAEIGAALGLTAGFNAQDGD